MKLYGLIGACSVVLHVALEWLEIRENVAYEFEAATRELINPPEYLALNPQGTVPLLVDGDFALSQNQAILHYLDECYPNAKLFGSKTVQDKAKAARGWLFSIAMCIKLSCHYFACQPMRKITRL